MKLFLPCLLILAAASLHAAMDNDLLPSGREFIELREGERNPFGQQLSIQKPVAVEETESEEARLRRIIGAVKISGVSGDAKNRRALMGSVILKPGDTIPPLIENQQEVLRVVEISPKEIHLSFVERDASVEPRQIIIPLQVAPEVRQFLYGEAVEKLANMGPDGGVNLEALPMKGVQDFLKGSEEANLENMTERSVELMGKVKNETPPPTPQ